MKAYIRAKTTHLLDRLQTLLKTDIKYLVHGFTYLGIGQLFAGISGLLLTLGLVRIFNQNEYGMYNYIISLTGIVGIFTHTGVDTAVAQAVAKGSDRSLINGFWSKLKWSLPAGLLTLCVGGYYIFKGNDILGISLLIAGATAPFLASSSLYGAYFNGKKQFKKLSSDNVFKNAAITISILLAAYFTHSVIYAIGAYFLSNTLISVVRFSSVARKVNLLKNNDSGALASGKHLTFQDFIGNLSLYLDKIIIFQLLGSAPLALYSLALAPVKQLQSIFRITRTLALPKFSTRSTSEIRKNMPRKVLTLFIVCFLLSAIYCILAQWLFNYFFPEYEKALLYSQVLSIQTLFIPTIFYLQALTALQKEKSLYSAHLAKTISRIVLLLVLIPLYGVWGAIFAFLLSQLLNSIILHVQFYRVTADGK